MGRSVLVWSPAILLMSAIAWFSHQPDWPLVARGHPDWLLHGLAFGTLAACFAFGVTDGLRLPLDARRAAIAVLATSLYGAVDEWHQSLVPGRDAARADWMADTAGAVVCSVALYAVGRFRRRRR